MSDEARELIERMERDMGAVNPQPLLVMPADLRALLALARDAQRLRIAIHRFQIQELKSDERGIVKFRDGALETLRGAIAGGVATGTCSHRFESNYGLWDTTHRYCALCGIAE